MAIKIAGVEVINNDRELVLAKLAEITETENITAVDVFIYDTSKDSDGGAWRHRTQHTSWYNETLNTSTRGSRKEFPSVAVIVAESDTITIYDGDDPSLPMWASYPTSGATGIAAVNGEVSLSCDAATPAFHGLLRLQFLKDEIVNHRHNVDVATQGIHTGSFATAHTDLDSGSGSWSGYNSEVPVILASEVNDVAMTVMPDAPTDLATGLAIPTIAVATDGGVSVIKDSGSVIDLPTASVATNWINFNDRHQIASNGNYNDRWVLREVPDADVANLETVDATFVAKPSQQYGQSADYQQQVSFDDTYASDLGNTKSGLLLEYGAGSGLGSTSLVTLLTASYTTGWMNGDIKLAALANSATADRSVNNTSLTEYGTVSSAAVATDADVLGYSGFSTSNYLEQSYNADLDFGTGNFCVMGWIKVDSGNEVGQWPLARGTTLFSSHLWYIAITSSGYPAFRIKDATTQVSADTTTDIRGSWAFVAGVRDGDTIYTYVNGVSSATGDVSSLLTLDSGTSAVLRIGLRPDNNASSEQSALALWRISGTAPTANQIRKIYEDEKSLFQTDAKATLTGLSDAVTALTFDPDTDLLHVSTSGGRSVFQGLRRVEDYTGSDSQSLAAISAVDGLVVEGK